MTAMTVQEASENFMGVGASSKDEPAVERVCDDMSDSWLLRRFSVAQNTSRAIPLRLRRGHTPSPIVLVAIYGRLAAPHSFLGNFSFFPEFYFFPDFFPGKN